MAGSLVDGFHIKDTSSIYVIMRHDIHEAESEAVALVRRAFACRMRGLGIAVFLGLDSAEADSGSLRIGGISRDRLGFENSQHLIG